MSLLVLTSFAQKDVTTFLGIRVDGFKSEMKRKLIAKGFMPKQSDGTEYFEGEFNGTDVQIFIGTNNNKVFRLMVCDKNMLSEADIKIRFNKLVSQFENNKRYTSLGKYTIPDSEDISYKMTVNNKTYEAIFYQNIDKSKLDTVTIINQAREELSTKYTEEELNSPTEEIQEEITSIAISKCIDLLYKKPVWFKISKFYGEYYISMFYDNEYNHANGEDL